MQSRQALTHGRAAGSGHANFRLQVLLAVPGAVTLSATLIKTCAVDAINVASKMLTTHDWHGPVEAHDADGVIIINITLTITSTGLMAPTAPSAAVCLTLVT